MKELDARQLNCPLIQTNCMGNSCMMWLGVDALQGDCELKGANTMTNPVVVEDPTSPTIPTEPVYTDPPGFSVFKERMLTYGQRVADYLSDNTNVRDFLLDAFFYDAQYVFYQIGEFTGNQSYWDSYAVKAGQQYETHYLTPNNYRIAGYWRFPHGIYEEWKRTNNPDLVAKLHLLRDNPAYSDPLTNSRSSGWYSQVLSREIAYAIQTNILAEKAGVPRDQTRLDMYIDMALQHINSWTTGNWVTTNTDDQHVKAFMTGLTVDALIDYYEHMESINEKGYRIADIIPAVRSVADWVWANMWVPDSEAVGEGSFKYMSKTVTGKGSTTPTPDLNLLIAPYYAWLYSRLCDVSYKEKADLIFIGGIKHAYLNWGKQFNQNYRLGFKYLERRKEGDTICTI